MFTSPAARWLSVRFLGLVAAIATMLAFTGAATYGALHKGASSAVPVQVSVSSTTVVAPTRVPVPDGFLW